MDDSAGFLVAARSLLEREGIAVLTAYDGPGALELLRRQRISVLLTDLMMPGLSGMDLLRAAKTVAPETEVVLMTAYGTVETAVEAMKEGAYDFVTKPLKRAHVVRIVRNALDKQALVVENRALRAQLEEKRRRTVVGNSLLWRRTMDVVAQAAPSEATVLLLGESGTGKEILARAIHEHSPRGGGPFIPVNCAAIPETILEAELFGYERGAFTGAASRREGRFEAASGGTLFLDEIGEIPLHVQVKLLRVLQEGEVERLGAGGTRSVREGRFREDLYYRLNVISVAVPPLRDRRDDIPLLAEHFIQVYREKNGKHIVGLSRRALELLQGYVWPGNVRELENSIERAVVLSRSPTIGEDDLPREVRTQTAFEPGARVLSFPVGTPLEQVERLLIHETLRHTRGDKKLAAQLLGIATRTIYRKLETEEGEGEE